MDPTETVSEYRLGKVEEAVESLRADLKIALVELGARLIEVQAQLTTYQREMNDRFVTRRDYDKAHQELEKRLDQFADKDEGDRTRTWLALTALGAVGSFVAAVLAWVRAS